MNINGNWMNFAYMDNPTLYTSAYLVASPQGYTKHYYAGSERIASAIGLGGLSNIDTPLELETYHHSWEDKSNTLKDIMKRTIKDCLGNDFYCKQTLERLYHLADPNTGTMDRYFYHPDHLGSSSWITDGSGNAIQHLHYLPFGEDWVDQRNSSWNSPYTFSGKEKDAETGYGYFGARYYDSGLSIWISVDPMSDKYPHQTNYVYCSNNPVMIIDPNGEDEYEFDGAGNLKNVKTTDKDSFHKIDANGNRTGESLFFDKKIVNGEFEINGEERNSHYLQIDNGNDADEVFSFLSDHVEMEGGEFTNSYVLDNQGKYTNLIGADINAVSAENYSLSNLLKSGKFDVKICTHNHKLGVSSPGYDDLYYAGKYPKTNFKIYNRGNYCTPFDKNTPPGSTTGVFPEVEVKATKP